MPSQKRDTLQSLRAERDELRRRLAESQPFQVNIEKVVATAPGLICSFCQRPDGSICMPYASPAIRDIYGLDPAEVADDLTPIFSRIPPDDLERIRQTIAQSARTLTLWRDEFRYHHPTRGERWLEGNSMPVHDADDGITWHGFITDVTVRILSVEALGQSEARYHQILDSMMEGCQIIDFDWRYVYVNETAARQGRYSPEALLNRTVMEVYPGIETTELFATLRHCMETRESRRIENQFTFPDGRPGWFELSIQPAPSGLFILSTDITERKQAEARLGQHTARAEILADLSQMLARTGSDYQDVLNVMTRRLGEFLGDLATLYLLSDDGQWLDLVAGYHAEPEALAFFWEMLNATRNRFDEGLSGRVIQTGQPLLLPAIAPEQIRGTVHPKYWPLLERFPVHSVLIVALRAQRQVIGVLSMVRTQANHPYTADDEAFLQDLGDRAALAISNTRLLEQVRSANQRLERHVTSRTAELQAALKKMAALYAITQAAIETSEPMEVFPLVVDQVAAILPAHRVTLAILDPLEQQVTYFIAGGPGQDQTAPVTYAELMEGLTGWVVRERRTALSPKSEPDPRESPAVHARRAETNCGAMVVAPLVYIDQTFGALTAINQPTDPDFSVADETLLEAVANQAAAILARADLHDSLHRTNMLLTEQAEELTHVNDQLEHINIGLQAEIAERQQLEAHIRQNEARAQALAELSRMLAEAGFKQQTPFDEIVQHISTVLGDSCKLSLLSDDGQWLEVKALYHPDPEALAIMRNLVLPIRTPIGHGLTGRVAQLGEPLLAPNVSAEQLRAELKPEAWPYVERFNITSLIIVPVRARGRILGTLSLSRDNLSEPYTITHQIFLEDLADRVGLAIENSRLFVEAQQSRAAADQANAAKSEFLSRMSHELRTPLNAILGFAQLLGMDDLNQRQTQGIHHILQAGQHLLGLINEVLDITRIETGHLAFSPEPISVRDVVSESVELVRTLAERWDVHLYITALGSEAAEDNYVVADRQRLKQILLNLLTNAIKYNRPGGDVIIDSQSLPNERLRLRVTDTGPGIPAEKLERLFIPFDRLDAEQGPVEGTGLGLALAQRLMKIMGGRLGVESVVGSGSTFWIELPLTQRPARPAPGSERMVQPIPTLPTRQTVLYVEDNLSNLQLVEHILAYRPGVQLLATAYGHASLTQAHDHQPDLILLDLNLPDMPGYEVLQRLRADPHTRDIPVVIVSADATPGQVKRLLEIGARAYLTKPLDVSEFLRVMDSCLHTPPQ